MVEDDVTLPVVPAGRVPERALSGALKSITVSELLHFLAMHRKSGKLTLRRRHGSGLIVVRNGQIIYAASSSVREAFGNILVCHGLISEAILTEALERQLSSGANRRLGEVLIAMDAVSAEDVAEVVRYQVACVLKEVDQWQDGFFRFDTMDIPTGGEIEVDAQDFVATEGLNTEQILLEVATEMDEQDTISAEAATADSTEPSASLETITEELPTLVLHGEISQMIMRRASDAVHRGILFIVREASALGIGHFGLPSESSSGLEPDAFQLPLSQASVISSVVEHQETYHGSLPPDPGNERLIGLLGGARPSEVVVLPVMVGGTVELVFYGDNAPQNQRIGPFRSLELLLSEAGVQIEKDMLDNRARILERARRSLGV